MSEGRLLQMITEEEYEPVEARINWLLDFFDFQHEVTEAEEMLDCFIALSDTYKSYTEYFYPGESDLDRLKKFRRMRNEFVEEEEEEEEDLQVYDIPVITKKSQKDIEA